MKYIVTVHLHQSKQVILANPGDNLLELLLNHKLVIESPCGGMGICGKCRVQILHIDGDQPASYGLACQMIVQDNITIRLPESLEKHAQIITDANLNIETNPLVRKDLLEIDPPNLADQTSDAKRIQTSLKINSIIPNNLLPQIPKLLRDSNFIITASSYENGIMALESGDTTNEKYGIAIDLGTTTIVGYLMDLNTGKQIGLYSSLNPQSKYGADVITRIDYSLRPRGLSRMMELIRQQINHMIDYFSEKHHIFVETIYEIDIVGNTVMLHLFAGLPVGNIAISPFIPVVCDKLEFSAQELGINICPNGRIVLLPTISGYIGADAIAAILGSNMHKSREISLLVDIGTNGEIALGNKEQIILCSTAAGPAFEGARIECGLAGVQGAINRVFISHSISYSTIGNMPAKGICGSGIIDVTAAMLETGIMEPTGRMLSPEEAAKVLPKNISSRIGLKNEQPILLLQGSETKIKQAIYISQKDIREIQLAKAAIAAGIRILMQELAVSPANVSKVFLTGGFGNYMNQDNALRLGLIPKEFKDKIYTMGNGAGIGAKMALLSQNSKAETELIKTKSKYIELSARADFQEHFVDSLTFEQ